MSESAHLDIDELSRSYDQTIRFLKETKWSKKTALEILEFLGQHTLARIQQDECMPGTEGCQFDPSDIRSWFGQDRTDHEGAKNWLKPHLRHYREFLAERGSELDQYLKLNGCRQRVVIDDTGSRGKERNYYYLNLETCSNGEEQPIELPEGGIEYQLRQLPKVPKWTAPLTDIDLDGWRVWLYLGGPAIALFIWIAVMLSAVTSGNSEYWKVLIYYSMFLTGMWFLVEPYYSLLDRRISIAPDWMTPLAEPPAQLEMLPKVRGGHRFNGKPIRSLRLVRYGADCSVCGAPILVVQGKGEFKGRLIGQCAESGVEHIFSFDHVSKVGVPLRANGFFGKSNRQMGNYYLNVSEGADNE